MLIRFRFEGFNVSKVASATDRSNRYKESPRFMGMSQGDFFTLKLVRFSVQKKTLEEVRVSESELARTELYGRKDNGISQGAPPGRQRYLRYGIRHRISLQPFFHQL
jgi:hypothetical protein